MFNPKAIIFDFNRTLYNPDSGFLVEGALELLENLSKNFTLVLYSKDKSDRRKLISDLGIDSFFKEIIVVEEKNPEDIQKVAEKLGVKTSEIVLIGDRIKSEVLAGKKAGCKTIWLKKGKFSEEFPENKEQEPDAVISELLDVLLLIKKN